MEETNGQERPLRPPRSLLRFRRLIHLFFTSKTPPVFIPIISDYLNRCIRGFYCSTSLADTFETILRVCLLSLRTGCNHACKFVQHYTHGGLLLQQFQLQNLWCRYVPPCWHLPHQDSPGRNQTGENLRLYEAFLWCFFLILIVLAAISPFKAAGAVFIHSSPGEQWRRSRQDR